MVDVYDFEKSKRTLYKKGEIKEAPKMTWNQYVLSRIDEELKRQRDTPIHPDIDVTR